MNTNLISNLISCSVANLIKSANQDVLLANLELENGANYLLENGGLIMLE